MILRPFFSYYGAKWRLASCYPRPQHPKIIEAFAGSACYALHYPDRQVLLADVDPIIVGVWRYLIAVSESDILALADDIEKISTQEARWLVGFWHNRAQVGPAVSPSKWMRQRVRPGSFWGPEARQRIASQLRHIRHWHVMQAPYESLPNETSSWFVDPPYQGRPGSHYRFGSKLIDYAALARWCQIRKGQVIVCEAQGADWLPFEPFARVKSNQKRYSNEAIWPPVRKQLELELVA